MPHLRALLLASLLAASGLPLLLAQAQEVPVHNVVGHEVYENGTFTFTDAIVVGAGATLTFRNATVYLDQSRVCSGDSNLVGSQCRPSITVDTGVLHIVDSTIDTNRNFTRSTDGWRIEVTSGVTTFERSRLVNYNEIIVRRTAAAPSVFRDNNFTDSIGPLSVFTGARAVIERNDFVSLHRGVLVSDATASIHDNRLEHAGEAIHLTESLAGDRTFDTPSDIRRNVIQDGSRWGIWIGANFGGIIEDNRLLRVRLGIGINVAGDSADVDRTVPAFHRNLVDASDTAFYVATQIPTVSLGPHSARLDATDNAFVNTLCNDVWINDADVGFAVEADFRSSWWGSALGPQPHGACASVQDASADVTTLTSPFRTSAPEWL